MDDLARLVAIEEIKTLKSRYFHALDRKNMTAYAATFTDDAEVDVRGVMSTEEQGETLAGFDEKAVLVGGKAMAELVATTMGDIKTVHYGYMPQIEIMSETTAKGMWGLEDRLWYPEGAPHRFFHGFGHYHETYRKTADGWRIASMRITRLRILME